MNVLAIDTATKILSVALETTLGRWYMESDAGLHHSERLLSMVDAILQQSGTKKQDLSLLACMDGPGSFTGLRIGFATVKGMAAALGIPFTTVPTLDCFAYSWESWPGLVLPVIDAKKNCFFWALYQKDTCLTTYQDSPISEITRSLPIQEDATPILITGPDAEMAYQVLHAGQIEQEQNRQIVLDQWCGNGKARELLVKAKNKYTMEGRGSDENSGPLYLRKSDAELARGQ